MALRELGGLAGRGVRLLALDLDGTVLTERKELTERTSRALERAGEAGIAAAIVTGRPLSGVPEAVRRLKGVRYIISSNGAVTTDLRTGRTRREALLEGETAAAIAAVAMERGLIHSVFTDGIGYCQEPFFSRQQALFDGTPMADYVRASRRHTEDLGAFLRGRAAENVWFIARSRAERDELEELIRLRWPVHTVRTSETELEIGHPEADKGLALTALAAFLGVPRRAVVAVGDGGNDLGLLRAAGIAVAMENAVPEVLRLADYVTASNEEEGVARVAEALLE